MTTPEPEQTDQPTEELDPAAADDEQGDPNAQDVGDFAEVPEDERSDDGEDHPANEPLDVSDVVDDGQVVDVEAAADDGGAAR